MDTEQIISKLNWFYSLELNQVELYLEQSKQTDDIYLKRTLQRASAVEQQHVENMHRQIVRLGGKPALLGDMIAPILGKAGGNITSRLGIIPMLKMNILLEQKAMSDYKDFILQTGHDEKLFDILWSNLIDEDFHTSWFSSKVKELQNENKTH